MVNLKNVKQQVVVRNKMKKIIIKSLRLERESELCQRIEDAEQEVWFDCLEEFFHQHNDELMLKNKIITNKSEQMKFMICFDNAEDLITEPIEGDLFRLFLSNLLERCSNVSVVITSQKPIGQIPNGISCEI